MSLPLQSKNKKGCTKLITQIPCVAGEHTDMNTQRLYLHDKPRRAFSLNEVKRKTHRDKPNGSEEDEVRRAREAYIDVY